MQKLFVVKPSILAFGAVMLAGVVSVSNAQAQSLYQPYYYTVREQYQTMQDARPPQPTSDQPQHISYAPDDRLTATTNQRLAQGNSQGNMPPPPPPAPVAAPPLNTMLIKTIPGIDFGLQGSHYGYDNPGLSTDQNGFKVGFVTSATASFGDQMKYFATADFRYAFGDVDYSGDGDAKNQDNELWEVRGIIGRDFTWNDTYDLSPYLGFGYRHLYNDGRGESTTDAQGYRSETQYFYAPIGVKPRIRLDGSSRLSAVLEYDQLIHGQDTLSLSDTGLGYSNQTVQQDSGYGLRGELMYENGNWSVGPFFNYWNIGGSEIKRTTVTSSSGCAALSASSPCTLVGSEPANSTTEYGLQLKYRFFTF